MVLDGGQVIGTGGVDGYDGAEGVGVVMLFGLLPHPTSKRPRVSSRQDEFECCKNHGPLPGIHGLQISNGR
jgi:hypothetical protein